MTEDYRTITGLAAEGKKIMNKIKKVLLVLTIISLSFFSTCYALGKSEYGTFRTKALLPKGYGITLIEKLNNEEMFVEALNVSEKYEYFTCNIETENCLEFPKDNELKDYVIISVFDTNTLLVRNKSEKYTKNGEEYGMPYLFDINTKKFKRLNPEIFSNKWIWFGNKFLSFPNEDRLGKTYDICDFETQKCEYGGEFPLFSYYQHIRLNDNQILINGLKTVIYNIKENKFYDLKTEFNILRIVNCGENLYCSFYVKDDIKQPEAFFGYGFEYGTIIDRYKFIDNKFEYLGTVPTDLKTDGYQMLGIEPEYKFWLVYGGRYGYGRLNAHSRIIRLIDTETGKTVKTFRSPFEDPKIEYLSNTKYVLYTEYGVTNKAVILEINKKIAGQ